jgi:Fe-S cluster assembly iron-binding protein IscA
MMILVTEKAKKELKKRLERDSSDPEIGLRLVANVEDGKLVVTPDHEKTGDHVVEKGGRKVLLLEKKLAPLLEGLKLDAKEIDGKSKLFLSQ